MNSQIIFLFLIGCLVSPTAWGQSLPPEKEQKLLELESQVVALERKAEELKRKIDVISKKIFKRKFNVQKPKAQIRHTNQMAGYFRIVEVKYTLEQGGQKRSLVHKKTTIKQKLPDTFSIFRGNLAPGRYTLHVQAKIQGYNPVLTYINNYKIALSNRYPFRAERGRNILINPIFKDSGARDLRKRLSIIFRVNK